jgi:disulfide bond formation protein DsbB
MDHPCHKCGQSVEDGVPFCSHCGAPQIRVTVAEPAPVERSQEMAGPAVSVLGAAPHAGASAGALRLPVQWPRALQPCALAALIAAVVMSTGLVALPLAVLGAGFLAVAFYLRRIPGTVVSAKEGARLGGISGLLCFGMWAVLEALAVAVFHKGPEIRKVMLDAVEQTASRYSDPQVQASLDFMRSPAGLTVMMIGTLIVAFFACVILASIGGALAGAFFGRRARS